MKHIRLEHLLVSRVCQHQIFGTLEHHGTMLECWKTLTIFYPYFWMLGASNVNLPYMVVYIPALDNPRLSFYFVHMADLVYWQSAKRLPQPPASTKSLAEWWRLEINLWYWRWNSNVQVAITGQRYDYSYLNSCHTHCWVCMQCHPCPHFYEGSLSSCNKSTLEYDTNLC
jgi:hypothetical protein